MSRVRIGARWIASIAAAVSVLEPGIAGADGTGPDGLRGLLHTRAAATAGRRVAGFGLFTEWHTLGDSLDGSNVVSIERLVASYAMADEFEIGLAQPIRIWFATGDLGGALDPSSQLGFGDLLANGKLVLPLPWPRLRLAAAGQASFPTGSRSRGMSSESTDLALGGLVTVDLTHLDRFVPTRIHGDIGYRWNRNERRGVGLAPFESVTDGGFWPPSYPPLSPGESPGWNDEVRYRAALEFETRRLSLFTEFELDDFFRIKDKDVLDNPIMISAGAILKLRSGIDLAGGADVSLQDDEPPATMPRLPNWRFRFGVTFRSALALGDRDHDGIPDKRDGCLDSPEDFDGFEDTDGCPDLDNDFDGVPDSRDLAPDLKEDLDGFEDLDWRPDLDNDDDGVRDADDACPNEPEDYDGDRDTDGCPE